MAVNVFLAHSLVVGFSFKSKGLVLVTPLFHQSGYGEGRFYTRVGEGTN